MIRVFTNSFLCSRPLKTFITFHIITDVYTFCQVASIDLQCGKVLRCTACGAALVTLASGCGNSGLSFVL